MGVLDTLRSALHSQLKLITNQFIKATKLLVFHHFSDKSSPYPVQVQVSWLFGQDQSQIKCFILPNLLCACMSPKICLKCQDYLKVNVKVT